MNLLFIISELPYPPSRNGISIINNKLIKNAPANIKIDLLVCGPIPSADDLRNFRNSNPQVKRILFTGRSISKYQRTINLISGIIFGQNLFTQTFVKKYIKRFGHRYDLFYAAPMMICFDFKLTQPLFLNAVDSNAKFNHDLYRNKKSPLNFLKKHIYQKYEAKALKYASCINFVSNKDAEIVKMINSKLRIVNISNGVDSDQFFPSENCRTPGGLLFTGNFNYMPNCEAIKYFVSDIFPLIRERHPAASLSVVGPNPPKEIFGVAGVHITGLVDDIAEYYRSAEIFICPLLSGAGVKNKIFEALSSGLPIVTTPLGVEGIDHIKDERHYLLATNAFEFASKVNALLSDEARRRRLGIDGRAAVVSHHSWRPLIEKYYREFRSLSAIKWDSMR